MPDYTLSATVDGPYDKTVEAVRARLGEVGWSVLAEIHLRATLKSKLGVGVAPQLILGGRQRLSGAMSALEND